MQSPSQTHDPVTTEPLLDTENQPAQTEAEAQQEENKSTADTEATEETGVQTAESPTSMTVTPLVENAAQTLTESTENTARTDSAAKPSGPTDKTNSGSVGQKAKKPDKGDGRKYVPSKKAMVDPLKMDMSKPLVMPLTSSQLSLQCIECHIIFSDHKSKERHLKLNHPAEYEQCILRNALFACYVCDRHFTNSTELMAHQKAHTEKKPFKCPICSQAFNKSSELTVHKKIHFGRDGYACTDCGKPCKTLTLLKYHRRTHTGERPYVCKECGKRFTMSKALQKHIASHLPEGAEGAEGNGGDTTAKAQVRKNDGASTTKYSCSVCKATFKSSRTRLYHIRTKHGMLPATARNPVPAGQQLKQSTPIITPISICQPALLQVEPNGPLQKVDANIDTEQIRRLIESMGNVQKVNQVVILGQVPPHAPPLEVQQISQLAEPVNLNLSPPQIDFIGLKETDSKAVELDPLNNPYDSMEQTIILEPITPDGQLENPSFSELGSHIAAGENIELTLVPAEQTVRSEGEVMHQILQQPEISAIHSDPVDLKENLEQTVILDLTPALMPTLELEQSQTVPQNEIPPSLVLTTDLETPQQTADQTVIEEQQTSLSVPPLMSTVELELTPLQPHQQDLSSCSFVPPDTLNPSESETNPKEDVNSQMQTLVLDQVHPVVQTDSLQETLEKAEPVSSEELLVDHKNNLSETEEPCAQEQVQSRLETNQAQEISELPVNLMSAQELVKVRKRKPARTVIFQGYMQDLVGSMYKDDLQTDAKPAKRQRTKKSHLVVKFGPQNKEKKNMKQRTPSQQRQPMQEEVVRGKTPTKKLLKKKEASEKKGRKGKREKTGGNALSTAEIKSSSSTQVSQVQEIKEDTRKNKMKKQKEVSKGSVTRISKHKTVASPMFKRKKQAKIMQKDQPKNAKDGKAKKNLAKEEKVSKVDIAGSHIMQDSLLLLKGHKQPQLKVYKLDPSKASGQAPEALPHDLKHPTNASTNNLSAEGKKKGGRAKKNQKNLSLLSSLQVSNQPPEALPTKPKATRKRKASSKVETEGVITSLSKRALECKDCGERFSEVSSLQKHKTTVHIVESPSLTYTNGNIFEGVSKLDLYQLPKEQDKVVEVMPAATDWDTEPEMALEDRERSVSFPALIPSPSFPVPPDVDISAYEDKGASKTGADNQSHTSPEVHQPSEKMENAEVLPNFTSESPLTTSTQTKRSQTGELLPSDDNKREKDTMKNATSESEVQGGIDEDVKEDLLLEVDLVTVGEQNERDDPTSHEDTVPQNESNRSSNSEGGSTGEHPETSGKNLTSQTVSCSTHQMDIKEEEEEMLVHKKKDGGKGASAHNAARSRRRGTGRLKRDVVSKRVSAGDTVRGTESEKQQGECQVVYEEHRITSDSEMMDREIKISQLETSPLFQANKATAPVVEKSLEEQVVFELEPATACVGEGMNGIELQGGEGQDREADQSPGIILEKVLTSREKATADDELCLTTVRNNQRQALIVPTNMFDDLVFGLSVMDSEETTRDSRITPEFNTNQCIFYPVKEEEREVLLGAPQTSRGSSTPEESGDANQTEHQTADCDMRNLPSSSSQLQAPRGENSTREPIDYFSKYFGWDTWVEIASCTNKLSNLPYPVTAREVARFVGIHIAMGTLKFPSPKLYWEDLTKVPLIAEAMPLSHFLEMSRKLKLSSKDPANTNVREQTHHSDFHNALKGTTCPNRQSIIPQQCQSANDLNRSQTQTDPLWKVQPLLCRFKAGCQSLRQEGDYAVDQYRLPLTGKKHNKPFLHCTALIGFGGLLLHVDLKLDLSDKEDAVEKMVPKGSMVFLCKQELSTPAMLEHLLVAGVHGAGRVGGARGQIGDEFVSSDGKLMLRRSHCGFILSTAGNNRRSMVSLTDSFEKAQKSARLSRDLQSLYSIPITASAPTCWPQVVLWYLTDLALVNSWLLYRQDSPAPLTLMAFRLEVSKALILSNGSDTQDSIPPQPPADKAEATNETPNPILVEESPLPDAETRYDGSGHWPEQLAEGEGGRCRFGDCQRTSRVLCLKCCVFLCISRNHNCFLNFHNQGSLGKE
uniref:C2H2-type domain-containing protein n=1 Tax=Amphiprion percula TaxID=161767 RepID=A0A3P8TRK1_AMPPE